MVILGIDPGIERVGYGILEIESAKRRAVQKVGWGCIETSSRTPHADRLAEIYRQISQLIKKVKPKIVGVEKLFFFKNAKTALSVSEARGVILLSLANEKIPIVEFTPLQVKQTLTNYGRADKRQIQTMVKMTLGLTEAPKPDDAADALAIAICALRKLPRN
ncbi:MAG TPA: crossover junction endodeoxyribonuclease RuvC [Patescibacteria group bacterium]|nr:crossover junction endodeoxyribonuclease RuvC [Patescibacteria group bacterium]